MWGFFVDQREAHAVAHLAHVSVQRYRRGRHRSPCRRAARGSSDRKMPNSARPVGCAAFTQVEAQHAARWRGRIVGADARHVFAVVRLQAGAGSCRAGAAPPDRRAGGGCRGWSAVFPLRRALLDERRHPFDFVLGAEGEVEVALLVIQPGAERQFLSAC